jgi:protein-tyrosine kinase
LSRIHEALKKAAQEKALQEDRSDSAAEAADIHRSVIPLSRPAEEAVLDTQASKEDTVLRFEDLVRRSAHPEWKSSAALEGDNGKVGAEGFRTLRSRLHQIGGTRILRRILVTSSLPAEGKTFVSTNLAQSIVRQSERRVLLIDADLRAGRCHAALGASNMQGLADYLRGESDESSIIQNSLKSNLCFISSGTSVPNPSDLLLSDRMKMLLNRVTPVFDWVILDSPPILLAHDASGLADLCDGVLFVVRAGATSQQAAKKASAEFRNKNLLGIVMNQVNIKEMQNSYYGYY